MEGKVRSHPATINKNSQNLIFFRYKRIFSIGTLGISTYNPSNLEVTNRWIYSDIVSLSIQQRSNNTVLANNEFLLFMKKERKVESMRFSSDQRSELLTEALRYRFQFSEKPKERLIYKAYKYHWSDTRLPTMLEVTPYSLDQLDPTSNQVIASYFYKDLNGVITLSDCPGGFVVAYGEFSRLHMFSVSNVDDVCQKMVENAATNLSITFNVLKNTIKTDHFHTQRLGTYQK